MGSFNTRCFLSHQTIKPGDGVKVIPIMQESTYNPVKLRSHKDATMKPFEMMGPTHSTCYSDAFWSMMAPMLDGTYDDYGRFALEDTSENHEAILKFFNYLYEHALIAEQGENKYHEKEFNFQEMFDPKKKYSFEELHEIYHTVEESMSENRVFVMTYRSVVPANLAVVSKVGFDILVQQMEAVKDWNDRPMDRLSLFESAWTAVEEVLVKSESYSDNILWGSRVERLYRFRTDAHGSVLHAYQPSVDDMDIALKAYFENRDMAQLKNAFFNLGQSAFDMRYFLSGLEHLEIKVQPMTYAGQDYSNEIGSCYLKYVQKVESVIRESLDLDDDDCDDDDDNDM